MASFDIFKPILYAQEGYYANKKGDSGGETWIGVARNYYPKWTGWPIIDANKKYLPMTGKESDRWKIFSKYLLTNVPQLQPLVDQFYLVNFWSLMQGNAINNQSIANFIGDWGVNAGLTVPVKHAQEVLGLIQDGHLGPKTLEAINSANGSDFFAKLKQERIEFYHAVVKNHPEDEQFLDNWLERTNSFTYKG